MSRASALASLTPASAQPGAGSSPVAPSAAGGTAPKPGEGTAVIIPIVPGAGATPPAVAPAADPQAGMAKREEKLVTDQLALKAERESVAKLKAEIEAKLAPFEKFQIERAKDPVQAMKSLGFSEEDIFNFLAASEKKDPTPEERAAAAAQAVIDKARAEDRAAALKAQGEANNRIIARFQERIGAFVNDSANAEAFEHCQAKGKIAEAQIYENVARVLLDTGELITVKEAAQMAEDFYKFEHEEIETRRAARRKPADTAPVEPEPKDPNAQSKTVTAPLAPKVVTNAARPTIAAAVEKPESRAEKKARIIEAIRQNGLRK